MHIPELPPLDPAGEHDGKQQRRDRAPGSAQAEEADRNEQGEVHLPSVVAGDGRGPAEHRLCRPLAAPLRVFEQGHGEQAVSATRHARFTSQSHTEGSGNRIDGSPLVS